MQYGNNLDRDSAYAIYDNVIGVSNEFTRAGYSPKAIQTMVVDGYVQGLDMHYYVRRVRATIRLRGQCG